MGGFIAPSTTIGGAVLAPGIPLLGAPLTGLYELPGLNGAGFAVNSLNYWTLTAVGFTFGNAPASTFGVNAITGSPFANTYAPQAVQVTPDGRFTLVCDAAIGAGISVYLRNSATGSLAEIAGSPFALSAGAFNSITISNDGLFAYAIDRLAGVNALSINLSTGALTLIATYAGPVSANPGGVYITADGLHVIAGSAFAGTGLYIYTRNISTGALTAVAGSPFTTGVGAGPTGVCASPIATGNQYVLACNNSANNVSVFRRNIASGVLTPVAGSPFACGVQPTTVVFSPDGLNVFVTNNGANTLSVYSFNYATGALTNIAGSPFGVGQFPLQVVVSPDNLHVVVTDNGVNNITVFKRTPSTGALAAFAGSPFATGLVPQGVAFSPDGASIYVCIGAGVTVFNTAATLTYNLINAAFDPTGGLGGALYINGTLYSNGLPISFPAMGTTNAGKFLRVNTTGTATLWDGVNTYTPVAMVANAGALAVDDTADYIIEVTGALTGNGALTATFTVPADPLKVVFDNLTTGGFPLILNATYTLPPGRSFWYWNGATLEKISSGGFRTANVTPLPAGGAVVAINHLCGAIPSSVIVEAVCLTAELGFSIGDVIQQVPQFNGVALYYGIDPWMNATQVGFTLTAGNAMGSGSRTNGTLSTLTAANWAYRFAIVP